MSMFFELVANMLTTLVANNLFMSDNYVSQFTVETYCFADGQCLFNQAPSVITIEISMTRRFQKSVGPSVRLSVCNANKKSLLLLHYRQ